MVVDAAVSQTNKTTRRSERTGVLKSRKKVTEKLKKKQKQDLTGPTLLEITDYPVYQDTSNTKSIEGRADVRYAEMQPTP